MALVHHRVPHCTGRWQPHGEHAWRCTECEAVVERSAATLPLITEDNRLASRLHGQPEEHQNEAEGN